MSLITPSELVVVRHGETVKHIPDTSADYDRPLTEAGRDQATESGLWIAKNIVPRLPGISFGLAIHSPMLRARHTAGLIGREIEAATNIPLSWFSDDLLRERSDGDYKRIDPYVYDQYYGVNRRTMHADPISHQPPGGQSIAEHYTQLRTWWESFGTINNGRTTIVAAHARVIQQLRSIIGETSLAEVAYIHPPENEPGVHDEKARYNRTEFAQIDWYSTKGPYESQPASQRLDWFRTISLVDDFDSGWVRIERGGQTSEELLVDLPESL